MPHSGSDEQSVLPARLSADVAIVGGGPVGCAAALAFARTGARVCLVDARPQNHRLGGEWLHPTGAGILTSLGVDFAREEIPHASGRGFAIFPKDGDPIVLPYVGGERAIGCQHHFIVEAIQKALARERNVTVLAGCRVTDVARGGVTVATPDRKRTVEVKADLIVGADGRQSVVRQMLGHPGGSQPISYMLGVLIDAAALPFTEFGNVFLGGPGPVLAFRVDEHQARVCFDVPADRVAWVRAPAELLAAYRDALPVSVHEACVRALAASAPAVAANQWMRRKQYGRNGVALVGDAVGHCHPLCAVGMSVGFLDAVTLARSHSVEEYASVRRAGGRVPELLSMGLYDLFVGADAGSTELREAVYHTWRSSAAARHDTMRLLAVRETRRAALSVTFARLLVAATRQVVTGVGRRPLAYTFGAVAGFADWAGWFAREAFTN
ncbi:FAD-dependent monooxygenase [Gemmata sp. G18]|uniref:FAD-dependent monooxygenase n=1 Tax=Gemmata palustris TaxID=2822762 RepID=A0ABS5BJB8_9BACT|nr:NAD(P)/FAD-dependent oxidoreductase [Gemmata palustris]MBP3953799.1 FAD-dependent monooxygenase [Gemmata palustris]